MRNYTWVKKTAAVFAAAAAACLLLLLYINAGALFHADKKILFYIDQDTASVVENTDGSADIIFKDPDGIYIHKLCFSVDIDAEKPADIHIEAVTAGSAGDTYIYDDLNPIYVRNETVLIDREDVTGIHISGSGFSAGGYAVDNRLSANIFVIIFGILFGSSLAFLIIFGRGLLMRPERAFLVTALSMGIVMVICMPRTKTGYDEETHLQAVFAMASIPSGELHLSSDALYQVIITEYNNPDALPGSSDEMYELDRELSLKCDYKTGSNTPGFSVMPNRVPAYIAMAAALKAGKLLGLGWAALIFLIRLANLAVYTLLMYFAIRLAPRGKYLMMVIGLLPQNLFMASTCSYDPFITGCMSLGYAFMLKGRDYILPMLFSFVFACLPKAVYAPVILMGLGVIFIPDIKAAVISGRTGTRPGSAGSWENRKKYLPAAAAAAAVFSILISVFILPTVISPSDTGDIRGGSVSMLGQVGFILGHPFKYAAILFSAVRSTFIKFWFGEDGMTFMGHLLNGESEFKGFVSVYRIMLAAAVLLSFIRAVYPEAARDPDAPGAGTISHIWMLLMAAASAVLIWTAMYVAFTEPGASYIGGVQGRYFIPLYFPVYLAFSGTGDLDIYDGAPRPVGGGLHAGLLERAGRICYYLLMLAAFLCAALTVWIVLIGRHCL